MERIIGSDLPSIQDLDGGKGGFFQTTFFHLLLIHNVLRKGILKKAFLSFIS